VRSSNPRRKAWTFRQAGSRKDQAERFTRDVLEDDDRADEISAMSVEDYAEQRGVKLVDQKQGDDMIRKNNGARSGQLSTNPAAVALEALKGTNEATKRIRQLEQELQDAKDELVGRDQMLDSIVDIIEDDDPDYNAKDRLAAIGEVFPDDDEGED
jgi:hypothetical protein